MKRTAILTVLLALAPLCLAQKAANPGTDDGIRAMYEGSRDLPNEIAYAEFLKLINATHGNPVAGDQALHIIVEAMGVTREEVRAPGGLEKLQTRIDYFRNELRSMQLEQYEAKIRILCSDPSSRTDEELYDALNAADDIDDAIRTKHLIVAKHSMTTSEQKAFTRFLNELKSSIGYVKIDSRKATTINESGDGVADRVSRLCESYQKSYNDLL